MKFKLRCIINFVSIKGCGSSGSEPWLSMFLVGKADKNGPNNCTTDILDHAGEIDYKPGNQVSFEGELDKDVLGDCYQVMNPYISKLQPIMNKNYCYNS